MRPIDADALKEDLTRFYAGEVTARDLIDEQPTVSSWISVKDRVPETNDEVLTTYVYADKPGKRYVEAASYCDDGEGEGHWYSVWDEYRVGNARKTVIAWMPMPRPYKPEVSK